MAKINHCVLKDKTDIQTNEQNLHIYIYHKPRVFSERKDVYNYYFNNDPERTSESGMNNMIDQTQEITT